jgi:hypothetical protein
MFLTDHTILRGLLRAARELTKWLTPADDTRVLSCGVNHPPPDRSRATHTSL